MKNYSNVSDGDKKILAQFDEDSIRVYQAYNPAIADEAIRLGTFGSKFDLDRMTWIKPSFLWMMYRSGWATKEGQERILAIDIKRTGFEILLANTVLSSFNPEIYGKYDNWKVQLENSQVRCQWDPDRDIYGNPLNRRAIQIGLKGSMVKDYVTDWILRINDITDLTFTMRQSIENNSFHASLLPEEREYPLREELKKCVGMVV